MRTKLLGSAPLKDAVQTLPPRAKPGVVSGDDLEVTVSSTCERIPDALRLARQLLVFTDARGLDVTGRLTRRQGKRSGD